MWATCLVRASARSSSKTSYSVSKETSISARRLILKNGVEARKKWLMISLKREKPRKTKKKLHMMQNKRLKYKRKLTKRQRKRRLYARPKWKLGERETRCSKQPRMPKNSIQRKKLTQCSQLESKFAMLWTRFMVEKEGLHRNRGSVRSIKRSILWLIILGTLQPSFRLRLRANRKSWKPMLLPPMLSA